MRELKQRFVDDYALPIQVLKDEYFEYFLSLYENHLGSETKWNELNEMIKLHYNGKPGLFLEDYYKSRDHIITSIENSDAYKKYNVCEMSAYAITDEEFKKLPKTSIYLEPNDEKLFLSVDMKQANFNTLKYHDKNIVRNCNTYDDFIIEMLGANHRLVKYFQKSKYTRQIIFGKLNMSRNITIQKYIMQFTYRHIKHIMETNEITCFKPYSYNTDELIYEVILDNKNGYSREMLIAEIEMQMNQISNEFHPDRSLNFELFVLGTHKFINSNDGKLVVYIKSEVPYSENGKIKIKSCPTTYYSQVYKLLIGQELTEKDLVFYYENQLAKFLEPLRFAE